MKSEEITRSIVPFVPVSMVDLYHVLICEEQPTPSASAILPLQCFGQCSAQERVCFQPLAPIQEAPVVRTRFTLDFDMSPDMRFAVLPELRALWCRTPSGGFPQFASIYGLSIDCPSSGALP